MLLQIMMIRLAPFLLLKLCRERKILKLACICIAAGYALLFLIAAGGLLREEGVFYIFYILLGLLPHGVCYIFSFWMLFRCIWKEWSQRVWQRIFRLSFLCVLGGAFMEAYWNPLILQFFYKIFK